MPSGALTLLEAAKSGSDSMLTRGVAATLIQESPLIERLPWKTFAGNAMISYWEESLPDVQFRDVNESYSSSWGTDRPHYWGVAILGGEVKVDRYLVDVVGTEEDIMAKQFRKLAKSNAMRFDYEVLFGDGTNKGFKGVKSLIDEGYGQKLLNASGGGALDLDKLDEAHDLFRNQGGPAEIWMNRTVRRKLTKLARASVTGDSLLDIEKDHLGRQVHSWNGVRITILGDGRDNSGNTTALLPYTEDPGDATSDCTSIYFVKYGDDNLTGLLGKGGSFDVKDFGELETQPQRMGRMEWYPGIAINGPYSIVRLYGITNA
jgi:hypothetical protein